MANALSACCGRAGRSCRGSFSPVSGLGVRDITGIGQAKRRTPWWDCVTACRRRYGKRFRNRSEQTRVGGTKDDPAWQTPDEGCGHRAGHGRVRCWHGYGDKPPCAVATPVSCPLKPSRGHAIERAWIYGKQDGLRRPQIPTLSQLILPGSTSNTGKTAGSRGYQAGCPRQRTSSDSGGTTRCPGTLSRLPR